MQHHQKYYFVTLEANAFIHHIVRNIKQQEKH